MNLCNKKVVKKWTQIELILYHILQVPFTIIEKRNTVLNPRCNVFFSRSLSDIINIFITQCSDQCPEAII